eukprot:s3265_g7.t1
MAKVHRLQPQQWMMLADPQAPPILLIQLQTPARRKKEPSRCPDTTVSGEGRKDHLPVDGKGDVRCELPDSDSEDEECQMSKDDWNESDSRKLAAMATKAIVTSNPFQNAMKGPQLGDAPRRYLGVVKPIVLYQMCKAWCEQNNYTEKPSWTTFLRALRASRKHIAFRKSAGQHGICDECMFYKQQLQRHMGIAERNSTMEDYAAHLLRNWRDRQIDSNFHAQAGQT